MTDWPLIPTALQTSGTYNAGHQDLVVVTATGALTIQLPAGTDQAMIGVKTVSNVVSMIPTELNAVTVMCASGDHFNVQTTGPASLDVSTVGQSLVLQYDSARHVWYVLAVDVDRGLVAAGAGPVVTAGQTVNTGAFFQSNTALDPTGTTDNGFKLFKAPSEVVWGLANTFDQPIPPLKGTIYQTLSVLQSKGLRSAVAVAGFATGEHVWGANFGGRAEMFADADPLAYGIEVDFGILAANTGECVGLHLAAQDAAGNPAEFVSLDAEGFSYPGPRYGYTIGVIGEQDVLTAVIATTVNGPIQTISTMPASLAVESTAGFPPSGTCSVAGVTGTVSYSGTTPGSLLNCTVASGSYTATNGGTVTSGAGGQVPELPSSTTTVSGSGQIITTSPSNLTVVSTTGFLSTGGVCSVVGVEGYVSYSSTSGGNTLVGCAVYSGTYPVSDMATVTDLGQLVLTTGITLPLQGLTLGVHEPGAFVYAGNRYLFRGVAKTNLTNDTLTGVTLFNGTSLRSIPTGATVAIGTQPLGCGPVATTTVNGGGQVISAMSSNLVVVSVADFPAAGTCVVAGVVGTVSYSGTSSATNELTGCTITSGSYTATNGGQVTGQPAGSPGSIFEVINKVSTGKAIDLLQGVYSHSAIHVPASSIVSSPAVEVTATGGSMSTAEGILFDSADVSTAAFGIRFGTGLTLVSATLTSMSTSVTSISPLQPVGAVFNVAGAGIPSGATLTITGTGATGTLSNAATASGIAVPLSLFATQQFVDPTGTLVDAIGIFAKAIDLTHAIYSVSAIHVPACSSTSAPAVEVTATGGGKSAGAGILFDSADTSTAEYGIRFLAAGLTPVTATLNGTTAVTSISPAQTVGAVLNIAGPGIPSGSTLTITGTGTTGTLSSSATVSAVLVPLSLGVATPFVDPTGDLINATGKYAKGLAFATAFFTDSAIDLGDGNNIRIGSVLGAKIGLNPTEMIGFWGSAPIHQPYPNLTTPAGHVQLDTEAATGFVNGTLATPTIDATYTGGVGSEAYSIGAVVSALKLAGILGT